MPRTGSVCCPFKTTFFAEIPVDNLGDLIVSPFTCIVSERAPLVRGVSSQRLRCCGMVGSVKVLTLKQSSLPYALFEACGAVFIMNSNVHLRTNGFNDNFGVMLYYFSVNHNYNKILKSDWFSTALISALIGQYASCLSNWAVRAITRALKWLFFPC